MESLKPAVTSEPSAIDKNFKVSSEVSPVESISAIKRIFYWMCGIESTLKANKNDLETNQETRKVNISIEEEPFWAKVNNINMIFQLSLSGFLWVFFNKFN